MRVTELTPADRPYHVFPAKDHVQRDEEETAGEPGLGPAGQAGGDGRNLRADQQEEAEGGESVEQFPHHALQRWLSTDWRARKRLNAVKLR